MKKITIDQLIITAFKGIHNLTLDLNGSSATLAGANGTGKTSVYDAFLWLLFGKNSSGASKFDVKPLDANGMKITGADTEVSCVLDVDGKKVTLKRSMHEVWKNMPGTPQPVYTGDETLCWIDGVPVKLEKEYKPYIDKLVGSEDTFKLLATHGAFLRLPWELRRKYLIDAAGGNADEEILSMPEFAGIENVLNGQMPEAARKRLRDQRSRHKMDLDTIPVRQDELQRKLVPVHDSDVADAVAEIKQLEKENDLITSQLSGGEEAFAQARALIAKENELTLQLNARKRQLTEPALNAQREYENRISGAKSRKEMLMREADRLGQEITEIAADITKQKELREAKLAEWNKIESETFREGEINTVCPYCGQQLPESNVQETIQRMHDNWAKLHDSTLQEIQVRGKTIAERIASLNGEMEKVQESLDRKNAFIAEVDRDLAEIEKSKPWQTSAIDSMSDPEYCAVSAEIANVQAEIARQQSNSHREEWMAQCADNQKKIELRKEIIIRADQAKQVQERIEELEQQKKEIGAAIVAIDGQLNLLDRFTTARCAAMEGSINAMFSLIRWKLFNIQKNGEISDCCDITVNGVPYDTGLNNAACINAGIEVIRVLSRAMGVLVPCFVDNAEAVNTLEYTGGQMILLCVTLDKQLVLTKEM